MFIILFRDEQKNQRTGLELRIGSEPITTKLDRDPMVSVPAIEFEIFRFLNRFGSDSPVLGS